MGALRRKGKHAGVELAELFDDRSGFGGTRHPLRRFVCVPQ